VGLVSSAAGALGVEHLGRLRLVSYFITTLRDYEARLASLQGQFDEVNRALENALGIGRAMRLPPTYRGLARAVGACLDASYCQIAVRDANDCLVVVAAGGPRPPGRRVGGPPWPLGELDYCAQAMRERRGVVVRYDHTDRLGDAERQAFLSKATRAVIILPFFAGPRIQGVLLVGEAPNALQSWSSSPAGWETSWRCLGPWSASGSPSVGGNASSRLSGSGSPARCTTRSVRPC
jgi:GAF domain-containing protein